MYTSGVQEVQWSCCQDRRGDIDRAQLDEHTALIHVHADTMRYYKAVNAVIVTKYSMYTLRRQTGGMWLVC
jgi:hypothetical protein